MIILQRIVFVSEYNNIFHQCWVDSWSPAVKDSNVIQTISSQFGSILYGTLVPSVNSVPICRFFCSIVCLVLIAFCKDMSFYLNLTNTSTEDKSNEQYWWSNDERNAYHSFLHEFSKEFWTTGEIKHAASVKNPLSASKVKILLNWHYFVKRNGCTKVYKTIIIIMIIKICFQICINPVFVSTLVKQGVRITRERSVKTIR